MDLKTEALLATAKAYINRGKNLQYDQRCMDRSLFLTPRRTKLMPPEAATSQKTLYLDCSSYVGAIFYDTFGMELPFDLTWHMVDYLEPRVFYYEKTQCETPAEISELITEIRSVLRAGDVITFDRVTGSGHTLLYMGDDLYTHCTTKGRPDSYDYVNKVSREYEEGGIFVDSLTELLNEKLFVAGPIKRIAVERPLEIAGEPTSNALARIDGAENLVCGVEVSHPGGRHAVSGEKITYTVRITNKGGKAKSVTVDFSPSDSTTLSSEPFRATELPAGETIGIDFEVILESDEKIYVEGPLVMVNGLKVYTYPVLTGKAYDVNKSDELTVNITDSIKSMTAIKAAAQAYAKLGINMPENEKQHIFNCFYLHDSTSGDVLSRRRQNPAKDMAVYAMFGGTGVVTPEMISNPHIRCNQIRRRDLMPGDIILCCNDPYAVETYSCYYNGETLAGRFEADGEAKILDIHETERFTDSLLGRFCFVVLRPSLAL